MARYIDAEGLICDFQSNNGVFVFGVKGVNAIISRINAQPTIETLEIKHGCWMYGETDNPFVVEVYCPWCGKPALYHEEDERPVESEFCPHCGAIMDAPIADPSWPFYEMSLKRKSKRSVRADGRTHD